MTKEEIAREELIEQAIEQARVRLEQMLADELDSLEFRIRGILDADDFEQ